MLPEGADTSKGPVQIKLLEQDYVKRKKLLGKHGKLITVIEPYELFIAQKLDAVAEIVDQVGQESTR